MKKIILLASSFCLNVFADSVETLPTKSDLEQQINQVVTDQSGKHVYFVNQSGHAWEASPETLCALMKLKVVQDMPIIKDGKIMRGDAVEIETLLATLTKDNKAIALINDKQSFVNKYGELAAYAAVSLGTAGLTIAAYSLKAYFKKP